MSELDEIEKAIKIAQIQIDNIDYNLKGLLLRREKLIERISELNATKELLLQKGARSTDPAPEEFQLSSPE